MATVYPNHPLGGDTVVTLRYCEPSGQPAAAANPNGSTDTARMKAALRWRPKTRATVNTGV